jgi:hypothetical protein
MYSVPMHGEYLIRHRHIIVFSFCRRVTQVIRLSSLVPLSYVACPACMTEAP